MIGAGVVAGTLAGFVLGLLGAGGTVVGLPVLLFLGGLRPHLALGTNALGVALVAMALAAWRLSRKEIVLGPALVFALPGLVGIYAGARLGLVFPGKNLVSLLGILLFVIAGWLAYASTRSADGGERGVNAHAWRRGRGGALAAVALVVGAIAGFFAIGGGFMIVPALAAVAGLELMDAAATALVPVALFAAWVGVQYWLSGAVATPVSAVMLPAGIGGGVAGGWLGRRLSKTQAQRIFAVFLVLLGAYLLVR
ncbi:MAG TPA: sulfite exporter TauE/SafE family protein [Trueperaceae bacterium]|nr:sulfite exporter TauE/SafE family protein [Trueperaceae bacterium]